MSDYNIKFEWRTNLSGISKSEWDACFAPDDVLNSFDVTSAISCSSLPETAFYYLIGERGDSLAVVFPCFIYRVPLDLLAPAHVQRYTALIRKVFPRFAVLKMFFVGNPVATCDRAFGWEQVSENARRQLFKGVQELCIAKAKELQAQLVVLKELRPADITMFGDQLAPQFVTVPSLPVGYLPLENDRYERRLRADHRSYLRRRKKLSDSAGVVWSIEADFGDLAEDLHRLYGNVVSRAQTRFRTVTPEFVRQLSRQARGRAHVVLARYDNRIIAFGLFLVGSATLHLLYLGIDYTYRKQFALNYNAYYRVIEWAEERGISKLVLGQTAYDAKGALGASFGQLFLAIHPRSWFWDLLLRSMDRVLFPETELPVHRVFKSGAVEPRGEWSVVSRGFNSFTGTL